MRLRIYLTALAASLAFCGTAQARPWLTMHRAEQAAVAHVQREGNWLTNTVAWCDRRSPTSLFCTVDGFTPTGDPGAPEITCQGCADAGGQEYWWQVNARLVRHRVVVRDAF